jgi:hypothetical protein
MRSGIYMDEQGKENVFAIEPEMYVDETVQPDFTPYAEQLNGRLAMIGFISPPLLEVITGHGVIGFLTNL